MEPVQRMVLANAQLDSTEMPVQVNLYHLAPIRLHLIFEKIEFDELGFLFSLNLNFAGYTGSKNQVQRNKKSSPSNSLEIF